MDAEKTIGNIVYSTINRFKNFGVSTSDYMDYLEIATTAYQEIFRGFEMPSVETVEMQINLAQRVWAFPNDFIALGRVAYRDGKRLWLLTRNDLLDLTQEPTPCEAPTNYQTNSNQNYSPYYWGGATTYGEGGGKNINYYRVDYARRRVIFSESVPTSKGVIEYLSAGKNVNADTFIPLAYVNTFRNLLQWKVSELSDNQMLRSMAKDYERQYQTTLWDANILAKSPTEQEITDSLYSASGFSLR